MWTSGWMRWAAVLGFALGGFFDGILLHQVLQWHHLLSLVPGVADLRAQVLWDGYFHVLMYAVAAAALWGLWRTRGNGRSISGRCALGAVLTGFGVWQVVDIVVFHWVLSLHRVRVDGPDPLTWDLIWLGAFGAVPLLLATLLLWRSRKRDEAGQGGVVSVLALVTCGAAVWSASPAPGQGFTAVAFSPGANAQEVMQAIANADARLVAGDPSSGVVVVDVASERRWGLYREGALLVGGAGVPVGCFGWSRTLGAPPSA